MSYQLLIVFLVGAVLSVLWQVILFVRNGRVLNHRIKHGIPETEALTRQDLEAILARHSRANFWSSVIQNLSFFIAGSILSLYSGPLASLIGIG